MYKVHGGFVATFDDSTIIVHPIHPITMVRPSPVTSVKKNPSALANDEDAESGPLWRVWDTRKKKNGRDLPLLPVGHLTIFKYLTTSLPYQGLPWFNQKTCFLEPGFTNTPVQKRGNQCFTESKSFGSIFDSEQSSTWLKNVQTIQNDRQHLLHGTRFTKVDQRLGPGIRSGHLWWMIGNAHENRNAHLVMVQTWAPPPKKKNMAK